MENLIKIEIPSDDDGFILLQCQHCNELFKLTVADIEDDSNLFIYCPFCGLTSENYLTENVIELAMKKAKNYAMQYIFDEFKRLEKQNSKGLIELKAGKQPDMEEEIPIFTIIDNLEIKMVSCCKKEVKINPLLKLSGLACPFCGVMEYGD